MIVRLVHKKLEQQAPKGFLRLAPAHDKNVFAPHGAVIAHGNKALYSLGPAGSEHALFVDKQGKLYKAKRGKGTSLHSIERVSVLHAMGSLPDGALVDAIDRIGVGRGRRGKTTAVIKSLERVLRTDYLRATFKRLGATVDPFLMHGVLEVAGPSVVAQKNGNSLLIDSRGQLYVAADGKMTGQRRRSAHVILPGTAKSLFGEQAIHQGLEQLQWRARFIQRPLGDARGGSLLRQVSKPLRPAHERTTRAASAR